MQSTLSKYEGKILTKIWAKFPQHPGFASLKDKEVPKWWTALHPGSETEITQFHMTLGNDFVFSDTTTRPLYHDNGNRLVREGEPIDDFVSIIHFYNIIQKLMKEANLHTRHNGPLQQRCWLVFLFNVVGRGGEIKLQNFLEWMWHPKLEVLDIMWT